MTNDILSNADQEILKSAMYENAAVRLMRHYPEPGAEGLNPDRMIHVSQDAAVFKRQVEFVEAQIDTTYSVQLTDSSCEGVTNAKTLLGYENVTGLSLMTCGAALPQFIEESDKIRFLATEIRPDLIDLGAFSRLEGIVFDLSSGLRPRFDWSKLRYAKFYLNPRRNPDSDLFCNASNLEVLILHHGRWDALDFLPHFPKCRVLHLDPASALTDVSGLRFADQIEELRVDKAKKVQDWSILEVLTHLRSLSLLECGAISLPVRLRDRGALEFSNFYKSRLLH